MIKEMSHEEYIKAPEIGSSDVKQAMKTLAHFKASKNGELEFKKSTAMDIGTAAHAAILEQDYSKFVEGPDVSKATKIWKTFVAENEDKVVLKPDEFKQIKKMYDEFYKHDKTKQLMANGKPELSIFWTPEGISQGCKARLDYHIEHPDGDIIVDFKTARDGSFKEFQRAIYNYRYDISAVHYINAVEEGLGRKVSAFIWAVQENTAPYLVSLYMADADCLERAKKKWMNTLGKIDNAYKENHFPGYDIGIKEMDIPVWAISKESEDD